MRRMGCALVVLIGCRADVDGMWQGSVGSEGAILSLEQTGSEVLGEICFAERCARIDDGTLDEDSLVLTYGCNACGIPKSTLDLVLRNTLQGEQHPWNCSCDTSDCTCRDAAQFSRCQGSCR